MPKIYTLNSVYPTDCEVLQQLRAECSGYSYFLNSGYINYYIDKTFKPYEHRLVAELAYGAMPAGYQVHHINGIRSDNRAANLQVLSPNEHAQYHGMERLTSEIQSCAYCGKPVTVNEARLSRHDRFYCNRQHMELDFRKVARPSADELQTLLQNIGNWSAIGRMYGVSDNAIRKWARSYGLLSPR